MSCIEFYQELRKLEDFKDTPIITVTAFAMNGDKERIITVGFNKYIFKPLNIKN